MFTGFPQSFPSVLTAFLQSGRETLTGADPPWASQEPVHQTDGPQDSSDLEVDMVSDDDGTASESSKGQITDITHTAVLEVMVPLQVIGEYT